MGRRRLVLGFQNLEVVVVVVEPQAHQLVVGEVPPLVMYLKAHPFVGPLG